MPPGIIKINDVECRNPDAVQRYVIVDKIPAEISEITSQLQRFRSGKNIPRHIGRGIVWKCDAEGPIANHVEQQPATKLFRPAALKLPGKIAAPVQTISIRKLLAGFFAIKKYQLNLASQRRMLPNDAG